MGEFPSHVTLAFMFWSGIITAILGAICLIHWMDRNKREAPVVCVSVTQASPGLDKLPVERLILELELQEAIIQQDPDMAELNEVLSVEDPAAGSDSLGYKEDLEELLRLRKGRRS